MPGSAPRSRAGPEVRRPTGCHVPMQTRQARGAKAGRPCRRLTEPVDEVGTERAGGVESARLEPRARSRRASSSRYAAVCRTRCVAPHGQQARRSRRWARGAGRPGSCAAAGRSPGTRRCSRSPAAASARWSRRRSAVPTTGRRTGSSTSDRRSGGSVATILVDGRRLPPGRRAPAAPALAPRT